MSLEKLHGTQIVTWAPPLPQRAFPIISAGNTSDGESIAGLNTDGQRYGILALDTSQWIVAPGFHTPPFQAGEQFQIWTSTNGGSFFHPPPFMDGNVGGNTPYWSRDTWSSPENAPELFNVYTLTENREMGNNNGQTIYSIKDSAVRTVVATVLNGSTWSIYFSPALQGVTIQPPKDGVITLPRPYNPRYLGRIGHVANVNYTYTIPGGPNQLTCTLQVEPNYRTDAINPGRIVTAHRGGSCIWYGQLTEPSPAATGWTLTANGAGTFGTNFGAWFQQGLGPKAKSTGWFPDGPIDLAIARGLQWQNLGIGNPAGIYTGPLQNPGSLTVTDFLNLLCTGGSLTWELVQPPSASSWPPGPWQLSVYDLPQDQTGNTLVQGPPEKLQVKVLNGGKWKRTDLLVSKPRRPPDLFIVNTSPIARTIVADYNTIILYYQATPDTTATSTKKAQAATYGTTFVTASGSAVAHGRMEYYLDVSNAGPMSQGAAQQIGLNVLTKYIRANFSGTFTVQPGQLLNPGGVPVDLGVSWVGQVASIQGVNAAAGGEVGLAPVTFVIGQYEYDDTTQTATITPYQSAQTDIGSIISQLYPGKFA